jgi:hypothetical protein
MGTPLSQPAASALADHHRALCREVAPLAADRETEMRAAHAHFQARLDAEIATGRWSPPDPATVDV